MVAVDIVGLVVISLIIIGVIIYYFNEIINFFIDLFNMNKNQLIFFRQYDGSSGYSTVTKFSREKIYKILLKFKKETSTNNKVNISSEFNKYFYPIYDLDTLGNYDLFKKLHTANSYVIFRSSQDHYWAILDTPYPKKKNIFYDHNWKICNDANYINFSVCNNKLMIRGLYESMDRKPVLYETNGKLSKNFQLFIDKILIYYNREALELSVLKYKDPSMLIKFNRKRKLQILQQQNAKS